MSILPYADSTTDNTQTIQVRQSALIFVQSTVAISYLVSFFNLSDFLYYFVVFQSVPTLPEHRSLASNYPWQPVSGLRSARFFVHITTFDEIHARFSWDWPRQVTGDVSACLIPSPKVWYFYSTTRQNGNTKELSRFEITLYEKYTAGTGHLLSDQ